MHGNAVQHNGIAVTAVFTLDFDGVAVDDFEMQPALTPDLNDTLALGGRFRLRRQELGLHRRYLSTLLPAPSTSSNRTPL